jgi:secondary thiamine-phosphate synthase enzyme
LEVITDFIEVDTRGHTHILDLTASLHECLRRSGLSAGVATVFVPGSTAGLTTIEYEPGLLADLPAVFEKIAPENYPYKHHETWDDDNGSGHVRAALVGPSLSIPFAGGRLTLGTWQQVVLMDFDTRPRHRKIVVQIMGKQ